ncbi:MAG TPA: type II toxin-antitoxin system RelE/ParE family toxin [Gemmataceae bacterium]|jgi:plasmid stabilization system protein ParE|nr:type II toxin-antitoxin system RelE/ParE family toxin [Gemmataceae bacterium]
MKYLVVVQPSAQAEIEEAYEWTARRAPLTAARWYDGLLKAIESLADNPQRSSLAPEDNYFEEEIRNLLYRKRKNIYRVIFTIRGETVHVLHFRRGARQVLKPEGEEGTG